MIILRNSLISKVNPELVSYICSKIIPEYKKFDRVYSSLLKKYSKNGYIKLWLPESDNRMRLRRFQKILSNKEEFSKIFYNIYNICSKS